ncbi:bone morphogenetic protein receptor type-1B-like protein [Dinothrombium tinctorium]|uniref:Serine/threonine-protein kinase receptor n=1 Tax=Dinothrombium tinctorium TaxID=1965070 RepID=A0A3S3PRB8_9ACAR|nr:bone morphogenetic protein receptor type-1B-like protein [Dinothrombium tinctorium]
MSPFNATKVTCFCAGHCPNVDDFNESNGTCVTKPGGYCFAAVEQVYNVDTLSLEEEFTYGCLPPEENGLMQCKAHLVPHSIPKSIACCNSGNLCNLYIKPVIAPHIDETDNSDLIIKYAPIALCAIIIVCVSFIYLYIKFKNKTKNSLQNVLLEEGTSSMDEKKAAFKEFADQSIGSGSGSGVPLLVQRTIAKQTELIKSVGKGRYGEVWKGLYRGENVAVKMFLTTEEASWFREQEIYQTALLNHDNILGFIAADIRGTGSWTQLLLITDFHDNGSLYDYLQTRVLDEYSMLKLMHSALNGLCHLHSEIVGKQTKPAIAHRDIKSKNILVKLDGTCLIADFGLAVRYDSKTKEIDIAPNTRVGTKRYMAPEILSETLNKDNFDAYRQADLYSMALVLWEIGRRCAINGIVEEYQVPYFDCVPNDPTFEDMRKVVCVDGRRPSFSAKWKQSQTLATISRTIAECWHQTPCVRLPSLRVKKNLAKLLDAANRTL